MSTPIATPQQAYLVNSSEVLQVFHDNVTKDGIWQPVSIMPTYSKGSIVWFNGERYLKKNNAANNSTSPENNTDDWITLSNYFLEVFNENFPSNTPLLSLAFENVAAQLQNLNQTQSTQQTDLNALRLIKNKNFSNINWGNGLATPQAAAVYRDQLVIVGADTTSTGGKVRITKQNPSGYIEDISAPLFDKFSIYGAGVYKNMMFFYGYGNLGKLYKTGVNNLSFSPQSLGQPTFETYEIYGHFIDNDVLYLRFYKGILKTTDLINFTVVDANFYVFPYGFKKFGSYLYFGGLSRGSTTTNLIRTNDNGNTVADVSLAGPSVSVYAIEEFLGSLYLSCRYFGLYKMTNPTTPTFSKITFDAANDFTRFLIKFKNFLIVGSNNGSIYRTIDGSTFTPCVVDAPTSQLSGAEINRGWIFDGCLYLYVDKILFFSTDGINFTLLQHEFSISFFIEYYKNLYLGSSSESSQTVGNTIGLVKKTLTL